MSTKQWNRPPEIKIDAKKTYRATIETNRGTIELELYPRHAPVTVNNFCFLAGEGFYDGITFHRVIPDFMIQGGDPTGTGMGGSTPIKDEFPSGRQNRNDRGTIAMANAGPNTGSSQFFLNLVDNNYLDTKHPVFGRIVKGMDVVDAIGKVPVDKESRPITPVVITSAEML